MRFVLIVRRYFELFLNFALLLCFALNCAIMIDMISSIFYQNSKPLVFLPNVYAYIWRCDHPIEMGFAPKDV